MNNIHSLSAGAFAYCKEKMSWVSYLGGRDMELPTRERMLPQPDSKLLQCLTLTFADCHCKDRFTGNWRRFHSIY